MEKVATFYPDGDVNIQKHDVLSDHDVVVLRNVYALLRLNKSEEEINLELKEKYPSYQFENICKK